MKRQAWFYQKLHFRRRIYGFPSLVDLAAFEIFLSAQLVKYIFDYIKKSLSSLRYSDYPSHLQKHSETLYM